MAALNLSSPTHSPYSLRLLSNFSNSRNAPALSFNSLPNPTAFFHSASFKHRSPAKRRRPGLVVSALQKLSETESVTVSSDSDGNFPSESGVYAIYDSGGDLQFVGITRNLAVSVLAHKKSLPELCCAVKVAVVEDPDKTALTEAWKTWLQEHIAATGKVPPGNEPGNSTWVKRAPRKKSDLRLTPGRHVQLTVPLEDLVDRLVKENKVVAFIKGSRSAPLCGFSQRVVAILENQGVDYESVDVLDEEYNFGLRETLKNYSNWPTFPQIFVNGELVGGCDILTSMYEKVLMNFHEKLERKNSTESKYNSIGICERKQCMNRSSSAGEWTRANQPCRTCGHRLRPRVGPLPLPKHSRGFRSHPHDRGSHTLKKMFFAHIQNNTSTK